MYDQINGRLWKHLRKKHKDWPEDKIKAEAKRITEKYIADNKKKLEEEAKKDKEAFEQALDREFRNLSMDFED